MNEVKINCKKGSIDQYDDFIDFINYVFGFNGSENDFVKLLPKLYKKENNPACSNYIITEDNKIRAAVGAFDSSIEVCNTKLLCRGIGNVAVHPYHRSKGYMKECMNAALRDMISDGIHFSALGGRRQRYNYFGFDKTGIMYTFTINNDNMRHAIGKERTPIFKIKENCAYDNNRFAGYCILNNGKITEIHTCDSGDFLGFITSLYDSLSMHSLTINLPDFEQSYIKDLYMFSEWVGISSPMMFNILNYKIVIEAFMKLKNSYTSLPDGKINLLIHGFTRDERLSILIEQGNISVKETKEEVFIENSHLEAMNLLFSPVCPIRNQLPDYAKVWLPLPLWQYSADEV